MSRMFICKSCLKIFDYEELENTFTCPLDNCDGHLLEVDELMIPVILTFIRKGYDISSCCTGHLYDNSTNRLGAHIDIMNKSGFRIILDLFLEDSKLLNKENFEYSFNKIEYCEYYKVIITPRNQYIYNDMTIEEKYKVLFNTILNFISLSNSLPNIK